MSLQEKEDGRDVGKEGQRLIVAVMHFVDVDFGSWPPLQWRIYMCVYPKWPKCVVQIENDQLWQGCVCFSVGRDEALQRGHDIGGEVGVLVF